MHVFPGSASETTRPRREDQCLFNAELTTTPAVIFKHKPELRTNNPELRVRVASGAHHGTRIFIGIGRCRRAPASAENFENFRQLPVFLARLPSEFQNLALSDPKTTLFGAKLQLGKNRKKRGKRPQPRR